MIQEHLVTAIKSALEKGQTKESIYADLLKQGRTVADIEAHFQALIAPEKKRDTQQKTIRLIVISGAILIAAGVFSFIAANWKGMTAASKLSVIVAALVGSYILSWYAKEKMRLGKTADAFVLLGTLIYGAGIFLVAQIFHIRANWPDGFILWMLGALAMAYGSGVFLLFYLSIALGLIATVGYPWLFARVSAFNDFGFSSPLLLIIATAVTFFAAYFMRRKMQNHFSENA